MAGAAAAQDGARVFEAHCAACHSREAGAEPGPGPNLANLAGRRLGGDAAFDYSPAFRRATGTWDATRLDRYLREPQDEVPGTWMANELRDAAERAAVVRLLTGP